MIFRRLSDGASLNNCGKHPPAKEGVQNLLFCVDPSDNTPVSSMIIVNVTASKSVHFDSKKMVVSKV